MNIIKMSSFVLLLLLILDSAICVADSNLSTWFESATIKVRRNYTQSVIDDLEIKSARNEFEPFQIVLRSNQSVSDVDVSISDFVSGDNQIGAGNITIFLVKYLNITTPSTTDGLSGEVPDILAPKVDAYYHETRNFFPFNISANLTQPIWFDVFVPNSTYPGVYTANVTVTVNGTLQVTRFINLTVWNFSLPATSYYRSQYNMAMDGIYPGYYDNVWNHGSMSTVLSLQRLYIRAGLRHRLSFAPMPILFGTWNGSEYDSVNPTYFQNSLIDFLGDGDPNVEYGDSELAAVRAGTMGGIYQGYVDCGSDTEVPQELLDESFVRSQLIASYLTEDQMDKVAILPLDEPGGGEVGCGSTNADLDYNSTKAIALEIKKAGLQVMITSSRKDQLLNRSNDPPTNDYYDMWIPPLMNVVGTFWDGPRNNLADYEADMEAGTELWWYQSCMTHGCEIIGSSGYYPQYMVDYPAITNRIFQWMGYKYNISGELYFGVTSMFSEDPWESIYDYGGNGDGTFFYPGVPNKSAIGLPVGDRGLHTPEIGGTHPIPIESIRLKMMREGIEDYDYLKILSSLGNDSFTRVAADVMVNTTYDYNYNVTQLYDIREDVADAIIAIQEIQGLHDADLDSNGTIEKSEMEVYVRDWKHGRVVLSSMFEAIRLWKTDVP